MADISALLQLGGMGVMAFTVIAVVRIAGPFLTAFTDRLLDSIERQIQSIDRLANVASSIDKRLVVVEQQVNVLKDLINALGWITQEAPPPPEPSRPGRAGGRVRRPSTGTTDSLGDAERAVNGRG